MMIGHFLPTMRTAMMLLFMLMNVIATSMADDWHRGRATHYGGPGDGWSIHTGSCGFGYLDEHTGTGWDIAALADANWDYDGSCGRCYEVACEPLDFSDGYGEWLERKNICSDQSATVVVMVTDTCPCRYPTNAYSNKRWCCGDMQHFDLSVYAFEKLADVKWGVIGIKFRQVSCDYTPNKWATLPDYKKSPPDRSSPWNWSPDKDKRPRTSVQETSKPKEVSRGAEVASRDIFFGGFKQGWTETSYSAQPGRSGEYSPGSSAAPALCTTLNSGGAVRFKGWEGSFEGYQSIRFWVKQDNGQPPDVTFQLLGSKGFCRETRLSSVAPDFKQGDWLRYSMPLNAFDWRTPSWSMASAAMFNGCSTAIGALKVDELELKNTQGWDQSLCIDQVHLFST